MKEEIPEEDRIKYLEKIQEEHAFMRKVLKHIFPEKTEAYYLCGEEGSKDNLNLPEYVVICPSFGAKELVKYKKVEYDD